MAKTQKLKLIVIDPVTDATETATSCEVRIGNRTATVTDQEVIRALYSHPTAKSHGEGSYVVECVEIEREDDGRYLAEMPTVLGLMAYGKSAESAALTMFAEGVLDEG